MHSSSIIVASVLVLFTIVNPCTSYRVHHVANLLDEETFYPHIKRTIDSQAHNTIFVRFFLHGEGDRTHTKWEHIANSPHKVHGATFADVDCSESIELKEAHQAGSEGWPMIKYFNWHTGIEGRTYHPPSHVTDHSMRMFVLEVIREAHTESRRKHHAHMEHKHGSKGREKNPEQNMPYHPEMEL